MNRRDFVALLGGLAIAWPLAGRAQQANRMRRVAALWPFNEDDAEGRGQFSAFQQGLREFGWADIRIESRWGGGDTVRTRAYASELVRLLPDVIFLLQCATCPPLARDPAQFRHR